MDAAEVREFVRGNHRAVLATMRADGRPQLTPVLVGVGQDGRLRISTSETARKTRNVRRDPRVSICVMNDGFYGEWAVAEGTAEVVGLPDAMDLLVEYYRDISGEHPDWDEYREAMRRERRVMILVDVERAGPAQGG